MEDLRIKVRLAPVSKIALNGKPSTWIVNSRSSEKYI
jgi:hypothetical protein